MNLQNEKWGGSKGDPLDWVETINNLIDFIDSKPEHEKIELCFFIRNMFTDIIERNKLDFNKVVEYYDRKNN